MSALETGQVLNLHLADDNGSSLLHLLCTPHTCWNDSRASNPNPGPSDEGMAAATMAQLLYERYGEGLVQTMLGHQEKTKSHSTPILKAMR